MNHREIEKLSHRQREVCLLLVAGKDNKETAQYLGLSRRTVEDHREKIFKTLRVRNVVELALLVHDIKIDIDSFFSVTT